MTVSSTTSKSGPYVGNGSTTVFSFSLQLFQQTDVEVVLTVPGAADLIMTYGSDYTVALNSPQTTSPGGTVTMTVAPASGTLVTILRNIPDTQNASFPNQGGFYPAVLETALDKLTLLIGQSLEQLSRSVKVSASQNYGVTLPSPGAGNFLRWNLAGTGLEAVQGTGTSPGNFIASGFGAVWRTLQSKLGDYVSAYDFGVVLDGVTDCTAALQACVAANPNRTIYVQAGTCKISGSITLSNSQVIIGEGQGNTIFLCGDGFDAFILSSPDSAIQNCSFTSASTRTSGRYIYTNSSASRGLVQNVDMLNGYQGISVWGSVSVKILNCDIRNSNTSGIAILLDGGCVDPFIDKVTVDNASNIHGGLYIGTAGGGYISNCDFIHSGSPIIIQPNGIDQYCGWFIFDQVDCDTSTHWGITIAPLNGARVNVPLFSGCWSSSNYGGVLIQPDTYVYYLLECTISGTIVAGNTITGATSGATAVVLIVHGAYEVAVNSVTGAFVSGELLKVSGVTVAITTSTLRAQTTLVSQPLFIGCRFLTNQFQGVLLASGSITDALFDGCVINGNSQFGGNVTDGITIGNNISNFGIVNCKIGASTIYGLSHRYNINIGTGCDNYRIVGNDLTQPGTAAVNDQSYATSTDRYIAHNVGYRTESFGTCTITTGNSSVTVTSGLTVPSGSANIIASPAGWDPTSQGWWVYSSTPTTFTLGVRGTASGNLTFNWQAKIY